jgi:hypothetical protein
LLARQLRNQRPHAYWSVGGKSLQFVENGENPVPYGRIAPKTGDCSPGEFAIARTVNEKSLKIATKHTQASI